MRDILEHGDRAKVFAEPPAYALMLRRGADSAAWIVEAVDEAAVGVEIDPGAQGHRSRA